MTFRRYTLASAIVASMAASTAQAVELDTQQISGQLFEQNIAEQAFAVEVLDRSDIELLPVSNIADALEWVSGLDVRQRGSGGTQVDLSIRGAGYEQTLILVDGVRMNDPQTGHHNFDLPLVLEDIERIEVVRGPGAGQYGPNGNAGVINLVTRKQVDDRVAGIKLEAGSKDYDRAMISLGKTEGNWSHFFAAAQQTSDTYIKGAELDYTTQQGNYRLVHSNDTHTTVLGLGYMDKGFGAYRFYDTTDTPARENTIQRHAYFTHDQRLSSGQGVDIAVNWRQHDDEFAYPPYGTSVHQTNALQSRIRFRASEELSLGYEYNQEDIESTSIVGNKHDRSYNSLFVYGQKDLAAVQLAGSVSYLTYDGGDSYTLPVLGITIPVWGQQIYANAGQSVRVPTMNDLYLNQSSNKGSTDVTTEETSGYELGLRFNFAGALGRLAVFNRETTDAIDYTQTAAEVADEDIKYFTARNIDSIRIKGLDAEVDITGLLAESGFLKTSLSYTRLIQDFTNQYANTRYTQSQFEHQVVLSLAYEIIPGLTATSQYKFESRYNQDGYRLWDIGVKQTFDQWHWALAATNVLGTEYIDSGNVQAPLNAYRLEIGAGF